MSLTELLEKLGWSEVMIQEVLRCSEQLRRQAPQVEATVFEDTEWPCAISSSCIEIYPYPVASQTLYITDINDG